MKNISFSLFLLFIIASCNSSDKKTATNNPISSQDFSEGKQIYNDFCMQCHMANGEGVPKVFPPLANSDYLKNNRTQSIKAIKYGLSGEITVNGVKYNTTMAAQGLSNKEIADVMNYITNNWGNKSDLIVTEEQVQGLE